MDPETIPRAGAHTLLCSSTTSILGLTPVMRGFPGGSVVKNPPSNSGVPGDEGLTPEMGRPPGGGNGNPLQYSCLENPIDRGAWQATVHGVTKSQTQLSDQHPHFLCSDYLPSSHSLFRG